MGGESPTLDSVPEFLSAADVICLTILRHRPVQKRNSIEIVDFLTWVFISSPRCLRDQRHSNGRFGSKWQGDRWIGAAYRRIDGLQWFEKRR